MLVLKAQVSPVEHVLVGSGLRHQTAARGNVAPLPGRRLVHEPGLVFLAGQVPGDLLESLQLDDLREASGRP